MAIKRKSRRRNEGAIAATEAELAKASKQLEEVDAFLMNQVRIFSFIISLYRMIEYSTNIMLLLNDYYFLMNRTAHDISIRQSNVHCGAVDSVPRDSSELLS